MSFLDELIEANRKGLRDMEKAYEDLRRCLQTVCKDAAYEGATVAEQVFENSLLMSRRGVGGVWAERLKRDLHPARVEVLPGDEEETWIVRVSWEYPK